MISATLDTSVYIRALHFGGPATVIIGHARAGSIRIDISDTIVAETNRVLRDKFQWNGYMLQDAREKLRALGRSGVSLIWRSRQEKRHNPRRKARGRKRCFSVLARSVGAIRPTHHSGPQMAACAVRWIVLSYLAIVIT